MSVYVDPMRPCLAGAKWPWGESCHLLADGYDELHVFAARMGLKHSWFQRSSTLPHYDLTRTMRARAVALGAIEVDLKFVGGLIRTARQKANREPVNQSTS